MKNPAAETAGYQDSKQPYLFQIFFWFPHPVMLFYISQETLCDNGFAKHNDTPFLLHHPFPPIQLTTLRSPCSKTTGNCKLKTSIKPLIQIWDKKNQEPDFYFEKIFPLIKERCRREIQNAQDVESTPKRIKLDGSNNYEILILPVGYALEPLLITSSILNPKSIHLIFSQDTQKLRESLYRRFEELCGITKEYITENVLKEDELSGTYHSIRSWWKRLKVNLPGISKDQIAVDISGGKKSMVSGAQLAANIFGFHVYYVDFEEFDIKQRRPVHGTEFINSLNPQLDAVFEGMEFGAKQLLEKVSIPEILAGFKNFVESNGDAINAFWESRLSCKLKSSPEGIGQGLLLISH